MTTQIRINITANNSGDYTVIERCYFVTAIGSTVPIAASGFFGSSNLYTSNLNFQSVYMQNGVWHSTSAGVPFIGGIICDDPSARPVEVVIKNTTNVAGRSLKNFTVEQSFNGGANWQILKEFTNQIGWATGEVRRFTLVQPVTLAGNATKVGGGPADEVVIRHWETRALIAIATPDAGGAWSVDVLPGNYDITYFAADCAPVCHGPYTVAAS